jgi:hypothetical protein
VRRALVIIGVLAVVGIVVGNILRRFYPPTLDPALALPGVGPDDPIPQALPASGQCLPLRQGMGEVACPYTAPDGPITSGDGIDYGRPFEPAKKSGVRHCVSVGGLTLSSGQIVAEDPLTTDGPQAFTVTVAPGTYPVLLSVDDREGRNAFALLQLGPGRPTRWELALQPGEHPGPDETVGYGVDAGTGCYMDLDTARLLEAREQAEIDRKIRLVRAQGVSLDDAEAFDNAEDALPGGKDLLAVMNDEGFNADAPDANDANDDHPAAVNVCVDPATGKNIVTFESGWGDGSYEVFFGYAAAGGPPIAVVTDFQVTDLGKGVHPFIQALKDAAPVPASAPTAGRPRHHAQ